MLVAIGRHFGYEEIRTITAHANGEYCFMVLMLNRQAHTCDLLSFGDAKLRNIYYFYN